MVASSGGPHATCASQRRVADVALGSGMDGCRLHRSGAAGERTRRRRKLGYASVMAYNQRPYLSGAVKRKRSYLASWPAVS